jgi:hypothetical protein
MQTAEATPIIDVLDIVGKYDIKNYFNTVINESLAEAFLLTNNIQRFTTQQQPYVRTYVDALEQLIDQAVAVTTIL